MHTGFHSRTLRVAVAGYVSSNRAVYVVDENGVVIYEWIAPNLGTEPNYDEVVAAIG